MFRWVSRERLSGKISKDKFSTVRACWALFANAMLATSGNNAFFPLNIIYFTFAYLQKGKYPKETAKHIWSSYYEDSIFSWKAFCRTLRRWSRILEGSEEKVVKLNKRDSEKKSVFLKMYFSKCISQNVFPKMYFSKCLHFKLSAASVAVWVKYLRSRSAVFLKKYFSKCISQIVFPKMYFSKLLCIFSIQQPRWQFGWNISVPGLRFRSGGGGAKKPRLCENGRSGGRAEEEEEGGF